MPSDSFIGVSGAFSQHRRVAVVSAQKSSGLSVAAFCRREGISTASFYRWRREAARAPFAEVRVESPPELTAPGVERLPDRAVEIVLASGDRLSLSCDPAWLARVVAILRIRPC